VRASFFGVGAPEALLVGVVALVLFGPKGLAQAVKSLGETLKTFAPTIRELTAVSTELKSTLEEEIGLNDLREELQRPLVPTPRPAKPVVESAAAGAGEEASTSVSPLSELSSGMQQMDDSMAKMIDPEIERRREEAAQMAWGGAAPVAAPAAETAGGLAEMSIEELEKELQRRKAGSAGQD
jgi:TatA/E family protein of Tat protein translocase